MKQISKIIWYILGIKKRYHILLLLYLSAIRKFYYVNSDYNFKWHLITSYLGNDDNDDIYNNNNLDLTEEGEQHEDGPYSRTKIKQMFNVAQDIRVKIIISLLTSSGLRYGAVNILKIGDLEKNRKVQPLQNNCISKK